jgi:hypothetical protein
MSETPDISQAEIEAKREELHEDTTQERSDREAQKDALLEAVKSDSDLGGENTVEIGGLIVRHKDYIPGKQLKKVQRTKQAMQGSGDLPGDEDEIELLTEITEGLQDPAEGTEYTDAELVTEFWRGFIDEYGTDAYVVILERLLEPLLSETQEKMDGLQSFPAE